MTDKSSATVLTISDDLPIAVARPVHSGKVRSVYFLRPEDSRRLIEERGYAVAPDSDLAVMVISDRLSAFDCLWRAESLDGVPGKGAALNAIAAHWFHAFEREQIGAHHLLEVPHPMVWIVRQAQPLRFEAIARRYLTGSLWRAYDKGERNVGGVDLPEGLTQYGMLPELLFTPSTKGVMQGLEGVPESDDAPVAPSLIARYWKDFGLRGAEDVPACRRALAEGFRVIEQALGSQGELLVDTKFEFGLAPALDGTPELIFMDEVGTPDSSRIWRRDDWERGAPREHSKEQFREALMAWTPDPDVLLNPRRMDERKRLAANERVPDSFFLELSQTYRAAAQRVLGSPLEVGDAPRESMLDLLAQLKLLA